MKKLKTGVVVLIVGSALMQAQAGDQEAGLGHGRGLGGVWRVSLAPRNCTTGNPLPVPALQTLFTFHGDGTMSASLQNYAISATNRTLSHGLWRRIGGWDEYAMRFIHLRYDFATGVYLGTQEAESQVTLDRGGETFHAASMTRGLDANGNQVYTSCANLTGERLPEP